MKKTERAHPPEGKSSVIEIGKGSMTVKIHPIRNSGKTIFMIRWFIVGTRHRRNLPREADARQEAALVARQMSAGDAQVMTLTSSERDELSSLKANARPSRNSIA
ncbi:MAG: hypothetical protein ABIP20_12815 [Chthoniobacteraceae bacterium]